MPTLLIVVTAAAAGLARAFRGPASRFWPRMTALGAVLAVGSLVASPSVRRTRVRPSAVLGGLASATALYLTFAVGDRVTRRMLPGGEAQIARLYALGRLEPSPRIASRLVAVIAPAEELFWRGWVQDALVKRHGRWRGAALSAALYTAAHGGTGNVVLTGAAAVAGAHWSALRAAGVPLGALVVSHAAWDVWIFLVRPTGVDDSPADGRSTQLALQRNSAAAC